MAVCQGKDLGLRTSDDFVRDVGGTIQPGEEPEEVTMLNADILKGRWHQIRGDVKAKWGKLTDDDLAQIAGDHEKLMGTLQKKYGYARQDAEREYQELMKDFMHRRKKRAA